MVTKALFFGTHPYQFNGYSKVVYEIAKKFAGKHDDIELSIYGFQNFHNHDRHRRDFPHDKIKVYDAFANEEPKQAGFGIEQIEAYVKEHKPDVCIVYNDLMVVTQCLAKLRNSGVPMKIIAYIDQVYLCQKKDFINAVNGLADYALAFTPYWETILKEQGITLPTDHLVHAFNPDTYYPIPKDIARRYFGLNPNDFIILNLNRNQPRKRWDICLKAFAEIVSRFPDKPIKMMIGTAIQGGWNLMDIYERELKKRNVSMEVGMKHLIMLDNPQKITDEETNILYNVADIGINTCDGEGFGLCNFEQAGLGIPQVVPNLGGFKDFFDEHNSYLCDPILAYYVDSTRDAVAGEALLCDYMDFVEGIDAYFNDPDLRKRHGDAARKRILENYKWQSIADKLAEKIRLVVKPPQKPVEAVQAPPVTKAVIEQSVESEMESLKQNVEEIDITTVKEALAQELKEQAAAPTTQEVPKPDALVAVETKTQSEAQPKGGKKKLKEHIAELKKLKKQIHDVLSEIADDDVSDDE